MATITYTFNVNDDKRTIGWGVKKDKYDSKPSKPGTKSTASITLDGEKILLSNITINSAVLSIVMNRSGRNATKTFSIKFSDNIGSENFTSTNNAYNTLTEINLNNSSKLLSWLSSSSNSLTFSDPSDTVTSASTVYCTPAYSNFRKTRGSASEAFCDVAYVKPTLVIDYSYKNASFTIDNPSIVTSSSTNNRTITLSNYQSAYKYKLYYQVGTGDEKQISSDFFTSNRYSFKIAGNSIFSSDNEDSTSVSGNLILKTFNGDVQLGNSEQVAVNFLPGDDCKATISKITPSSNTKISNQQHCAIPGKSKITFTFSASGTNGATIKKYFVKSQAGSGSINIESTDKAVSFFLPSSTKTSFSFDCQVLDSRGLVTTKTITIYLSPNLTDNNLTINQNFRVANSSDTGEKPSKKEDGEYLHLKYTYVSSGEYRVITSNETKPITGEVTIVRNNQNYYLIGSTSNSTHYGLLSLNKKTPLQLSADFSCTFSVNLTYGSYVITKQVTYSTTNYLLHFYKNKNSVGIGCPAENTDKNIIMGWPVKFKEGVSFYNSDGSYGGLGISSGGTGASSRPVAWTNIVAPGGTITGSLTASSTLKIANHEFSPQLQFYPSQLSNYAGSIRYTIGPEFNTGRFYFHQRSLNLDGTGFSGGAERYFLPIVDNGITAEKPIEYHILTTKTVIYWDGTGNQPAAINGGIMLKKI